MSCCSIKFLASCNLQSQRIQKGGCSKGAFSVNSSNLSRRIDSSIRAVPSMTLFQENVGDIDYESAGTLFFKEREKNFPILSIRYLLIVLYMFAEHSTVAEFEGDYSDFFHDDGNETKI